jgi:hypothetical protein
VDTRAGRTRAPRRRAGPGGGQRPARRAVPPAPARRADGSAQCARATRRAKEIELRAFTPVAADSDATNPAALLARMPDQSSALQHAPPATRRQVFDAFGPRITYDKLGRRNEISAIISEATADAVEERDTSRRRLSIARIVQDYRLAA